MEIFEGLARLLSNILWTFLKNFGGFLWTFLKDFRDYNCGFLCTSLKSIRSYNRGCVWIFKDFQAIIVDFFEYFLRTFEVLIMYLYGLWRLLWWRFLNILRL